MVYVFCERDLADDRPTNNHGGGDMLVTHSGRMGLALAAMILAAAACSGGDSGADSLGDTGAVRSASGDVAGSNMASPAMVAGFLTTVNQGEIEAGQLAQTKATNAQVRQYAQMMVTDHRRANTMVDSASGTTGGTGTAATRDSAAGPNPAGGQPAADVHRMNQQAMTTLQNTPKGRTFDSTYIALMVTGHQDVLTRLEGMRGTGGTASGSTAPGATGAAGTGTPAGTGNPSAVGSTGTTQPAGALNQGDAVQTQLQTSIEMVRQHLERAQEIQRTLQGGTR
jgi:putative membrane protein